MTGSSDGRKRCLTGLAEIGMTSLILLGLSIAARGQEIHVKFLNARTGRPVTYEGATMWVETYHGFLSAPADNKEGTAKFLYTGHSIRAIWPPNSKLPDPSEREVTIPPGPIKIAAAPDAAAGICWDLGPLHQGPWYPISEILQHGAVSENNCGKATATPKPGELILFIKPIPAWKRILGGFSE